MLGAYKVPNFRLEQFFEIRFESWSGIISPLRENLPFWVKFID
jgi:hypothetical protein